MFNSTSIIKELIKSNEWVDVPNRILTREGYSVDTSTDIWHLPYLIYSSTKINFSNISEPGIRWITKRYVQERLEITSTSAGYISYLEILRQVLCYQSKYGLTESNNRELLKQRLVSLFEKVIADARAKHSLWKLYCSIQWYVWCAENYPEIGFCPEYSMELRAISIPGNPTGEAVRMLDAKLGPLNPSLELPLLIQALRSDNSLVFQHLQQKAALALSLALGRNSANLTFLKERDLVNLTSDLAEPCWIIRMPRIKKRQLSPRDDLVEEYLDPEFASYLLNLIAANKFVSTQVETTEGLVEIDKPLFISRNKNQAAMASGLLAEAFNMTSDSISKLLKAFVRRHNIISPLTGSLLNLSTRRLRYTLGSSLAAEGVSQRELARILDHSDTQNVQVYFELAGSIVESLDKAAAKGFIKYLNLFRGRIVNDFSEAVNGNRNDKSLSFVSESNSTDQTEIGVCGEGAICHLDPPFSCYLCPKFQPYRYADHKHVLDCLLEERTLRIKRYENAHLGIQLDDVIIAVTQVVEQCQMVSSHV